MSKTQTRSRRIAIIGGCGHVGLPLGVTFATRRVGKVLLVDIDKQAIARVKKGRFPFCEKGGDRQLRRALQNGLEVTSNPADCKGSDVFVFVTGTPIDEYLNPKIHDVLNIFEAYEEYFSPGALVIMRSTLFPGTMEHLRNHLLGKGFDIKLAFCPERVAQGFALEEIESLPQIVSAFDDDSFEAACEVFSRVAPAIVRLTPIEAELTKLMNNSWRYLEFAIANQFYMIAESKGVDFFRVYQALRHDYPRARGYSRPGLAAGPCLFKDTMQLASYFDHQFYLGHSAMLVNEGMATFIAMKAARMLGDRLWGKTVGLLGMTFKADNDDTRDSLSFKVKKDLEFQGAKVIFHDPFLPEAAPLKKVLHDSDILILCVPHSAYGKIKPAKPLIDVWGFFRQPDVEVIPGRVRAGSKRS